MGMGHPCLKVWRLNSLACATLYEGTERELVMETNLCPRISSPAALPRFIPFLNIILCKNVEKNFLDGIVIIRMYRTAFVSALRYEINSEF
jgi:hypothetical protein